MTRLATFSIGIPILLVAIAGCGSNEQRSASRGGVASTTAIAHQGAAHQHRRRHAERGHQVRVRRPPRTCPRTGKTLRGVYHPERLSILDRCLRARGRVALVRDYEEDGDLHFDVAVKEKRLLTSSNYSQQDGLLVVELMPRDHGHLPPPAVGDRVDLIGAWVDDTEHGWNEIHPVFDLRINGDRWHSSGPRFGGSPPTPGQTTPWRCAGPRPVPAASATTASLRHHQRATSRPKPRRRAAARAKTATRPTRPSASPPRPPISTAAKSRIGASRCCRPTPIISTRMGMAWAASRRGQKFRW